MENCSVKKDLESEIAGLVFELMLLVDTIESLEGKELTFLKFLTKRAKKVLDIYWGKRL